MKDCRDCIHYHNEPMQGGSVEICTARKGEFYGSYVIKNVYDSCSKHRTPMQDDNSKLKEKTKKLKKENKDLRQQVSDLEEQISWAEKGYKKLKKALEILIRDKLKPSAFIGTSKLYKSNYGEEMPYEKAVLLIDFIGTEEEYKLLQEVLENEK